MEVRLEVLALTVELFALESDYLKELYEFVIGHHWVRSSLLVAANRLTIN